MKPVVLPALLVAALPFSAYAADPIMPAPEPAAPVAPMVEEGTDWTGFYLGVGASVSRQSYEYEGDGSAGQPDFAFYPTVYGGEAVIGGNVQFDSLVFGVEATGGAYTFSGDGTGDVSEIFDGAAPADVPFDYSSSGYAAGLSARLGYLVTPSVLVYGSAGARAIYSDGDTTFTYDDGNGEQTEEVDPFGNLFGTIGGGVELAMNESVSVDLEYAYGFSAAGMFEDEIPELEGLNSDSHTVSAQILFHF